MVVTLGDANLATEATRLSFDSLYMPFKRESIKCLNLYATYLQF